MPPVTAVDVLERQLELEKEAREVMPYEPDRCTYPQPLRQLVFTCLTCLRANNNTPIGVCYLCLIQCHSTHELVELLPKRLFVCDCGTSRMKNGHACELRIRMAKEDAKNNNPGSQGNQDEGLSHQSNQNSANPPIRPHQLNRQGIPKLRAGLSSTHFHSLSPQQLPAEDVPSSSNTYNHNYKGRFCSCKEHFNPFKETRTMHQCYFGEFCGEDWFHQDCILGYKPGLFSEKHSVPGENKLALLASPGLDAEHDRKGHGSDSIDNLDHGQATETEIKNSKPNVPQGSLSDHADSDGEEGDVIPYFPALDSFSEFVCWGCIEAFREAFDELSSNSKITAAKIPHFEGIGSAHEWKNRYDEYVTGEPQAKKIKNGKESRQLYTLFLSNDYKEELKKIKESAPLDSPVGALLRTFDFMCGEDVIYSPKEEADNSSSTGSLYDMGTEALQALPGQQAIEGLHAYGLMKSRLRDFFQGFVDNKKVVTEDEIRGFFDNLKHSN